jgi:hypothetical protein
MYSSGDVLNCGLDCGVDCGLALPCKRQSEPCDVNCGLDSGGYCLASVGVSHADALEW